MPSRIRWRAPVYQNTGSTARDHLASERTFLAWMRTALGFVALGIAIERFQQLDLHDLLRPPPPPVSSSSTGVEEGQGQGQGQGQGKGAASKKTKLLQREEDEEAAREQRTRDRDREQSQVLVGTLLGLGAGSIVYGAARYFSNLRHLERGTFVPAYRGAAVLAAAVAGLAGGVYGSALRRAWERRRGREGEVEGVR